MIPLRDNVPSRGTPVMTVLLIATNVLVFLYELSLGRALPRLFYELAVIPSRYVHGVSVTPSGGVEEANFALLVFPLFASMFLHGGWLHLLGNMLYLWIFGDNVEDRMGHFRFLIFYLICGLAATFGHIWSSPNSTMPSLGASGAIAGVLSGYLMLYPRAKVLILVPMWFFFTFEVPAMFFLGFWFLQQLLFGIGSLGPASAQTGGVAWWAHIGGFLAGAILVHVFTQRRYEYVRREPGW
jgi:membrane associated rhomboid family serine protease